MRRALVSLALLALTALAAPAAAQADQAKVLFDAGAQAYEAGQYAAAVQAFEQAYKLAARPGILFSIGQAHRKQFYATRSQVALRAAVDAYRGYLAQVAQGGRRSDAAAAIGELEPLLRGDAGPAIAAPQATRLMVSSQTAGAVITLDGGKPLEVPLIAEVKPGKHSLVLSAPGCFDEPREIEIGAGSVAALDIPLRDKPGRLTVKSSTAAQVSLDGRFVANTPLGRPIEVAPGRHLLVVAANGHEAYSHEIEVGRDEAKVVDARLARTGQRTASIVLMGLGLGGAAAGGVLSGLAVYQQRRATDLDASRKTLTPRCDTPGGGCPTLDEYTKAKNARDDLRRYAGFALAGAALVGGAGVVLFAFDPPNLGAAPIHKDESPKAPTPGRARPLEISAAPLLGPGLYGASLQGTF